MNYFSPDRIFIVYGHSGELIRGALNTNKYKNAILKAEQEFERFDVPPDTFTANMVPVSLAAPTIPISIFYTLDSIRIPVPGIEKSRFDYKRDIQKLGSLLYEKSVIANSDPNPSDWDQTPRMTLTLSINPDKAEGIKGGPQRSWERFHTHGPRPLYGSNQTPRNAEISKFLFTAPTNKINTFTAMFTGISVREGILRLGSGLSPSGAMRLTDLKSRFPTGDADDPLFIDSLVKNYTIGQIISNYDKCVTNLVGTPVEVEYKRRLSSTSPLQDLVNQEIQKFKQKVVWDILPIPGTATVMTNASIDSYKILDIYDKSFRSNEIVNWIRQAAGPGPILVIFQHCRSYRIRSEINAGATEEFRNNSAASGQLQATVRQTGRPLLARTQSMRAQGLLGGTRKKLKHIRHGKRNTHKR
jgi:hypothetical protein